MTAVVSVPSPTVRAGLDTSSGHGQIGIGPPPIIADGTCRTGRISAPMTPMTVAVGWWVSTTAWTSGRAR